MSIQITDEELKQVNGGFGPHKNKPGIDKWKGRKKTEDEIEHPFEPTEEIESVR